MPEGDEGRHVTLTVPTGEDKWVDRRDAQKWMNKLIRKGCAARETTFEGDIVTIPVKTVVQGMKYKVIFKDVPNVLFNEVIMPILQEVGHVEVQSREEIEQANARYGASRIIRQTSRQAIGDYAKSQALVQELMKMHGGGGSESKRRKFAQDCSTVLNRSGTVNDRHLSERAEEAQQSEEAQQ